MQKPVVIGDSGAIARWFGPEVQPWRHPKAYTSPSALPAQTISKFFQSQSSWGSLWVQGI